MARTDVIPYYGSGAALGAKSGAGRKKTTSSARKPSTAGGGSSSRGGGSSSRGGGSSSRGGGASSTPSYIKAQEARERAANRASYRNLGAQIRLLTNQAHSIRFALDDPAGLQNALNIRLANIDNTYAEQRGIMLRNFEERAASLREQGQDNDKEISDKSFLNLLNRAQERGQAMQQIASQGGGESDTLRALGMSFRNWQNNQQDNMRGYYDSMQNLNNNIVDLNTKTLEAQTELFGDTERDREEVYGSYYDSRSEAYTNLANVYGEIGEQQGNRSALSQTKGTGVKKPKKQAKKDSVLRDEAHQSASNMFQKAAEEAGKAYTRQALPTDITEWQGQAKLETRHNMVDADSGFNQQTKLKAPSGAKLVKWK